MQPAVSTENRAVPDGGPPGGSGPGFAQLRAASSIGRGESDVTVRAVAFGILMMLAAAKAQASSITILVGDKDNFGLGAAAQTQLPCLTNPGWSPDGPSNQANCIAPLLDWRSAAEQSAANGAQLTDTYSALYSGTESDCTGLGMTCTLNGETGLIILPFAGQLTSASLSFLMADFESGQNLPMLADINGIPVDFAYNHGYRQIGFDSIVLTPEMLAAANAVGEVRLFLDHRAAFFGPSDERNFGSFDYVAFDYFELQAEVVPEPGTWVLLGTGLLALAARLRRARRS